MCVFAHLSPGLFRTVCSGSKQERKRGWGHRSCLCAARMGGLCCLSWECTWAARLQAGMRLMHTEPVGVSLFQSHRREGAAAGEEQAPARTAMWQGCCSQDWALGKAGRGGMGQRACGSTSPVPQQGSGTDSLYELIPLWPGYTRTLTHMHTDRGVQSAYKYMRAYCKHARIAVCTLTCC